MITMRNFLLHCASPSAMNTVHYLTRIRFALVLQKIHFTLDDKIHFCGICIVELYAKKSPHLRKSVSQVYLQNGTYQDIIKHLERKMEFNGLESLALLVKTKMTATEKKLKWQKTPIKQNEKP